MGARRTVIVLAKKIPWPLLAGWLCLLAVSAPIYFAAKRGWADVLYYESFVTDLFRDGGRWLGWDLFAAPAYFPDIFLYIIGYFTLHYTMDRVFFAAIGDIVLIVLAAHFLLRRLASRPANLYLANLLVMSVVSYCSYTTGMFLYSNASSTHIGTWIFSLLALALAIDVLRGARWRAAVLVPIIAFATLNDRLFVISYTLPMLATCLPFAVACRRRHPAHEKLRPLLSIMVCCVLGTLLSQLVRPFALPYDQIGTRIPLSADMLRVSLDRFIAASRVMPHSPPWFYFLAGLWALGLGGCLWYAILHRRRRKDAALYFSAVFTLAAVPVIVVLTVISGATIDSPYRYFQMAMVMPIFMLFVLAADRWPHYAQSAAMRGALTGFAVLALCYTLMHFNQIKPRALSVAQVRSFYGVYEKALARCLDAHKEEYGLHTGVGEFCEVRPVNLLSEKGLRMTQVNMPRNPPVPNFPFEIRGWVLDPMHYATNIDWDLGAPGTAFAEPFYNFVIVNAGLTEEMITRQAAAGLPAKTFMCPDIIPTKIMVYDKDSGFDALMKDKARVSHRTYDFQRGRVDSISYPAYVLPTETGVISGRWMVAKEGVAAASRFLTFGPHLKLPRGRYKATLTYETSALPEGETAGYWDVTLYDRQVERQPIPAGAPGREQTMQLAFAIKNREEEKLHVQFRTSYLGRGDLTIRSILLERVP